MLMMRLWLNYYPRAWSSFCTLWSSSITSLFIEGCAVECPYTWISEPLDCILPHFIIGRGNSLYSYVSFCNASCLPPEIRHFVKVFSLILMITNILSDIYETTPWNKYHNDKMLINIIIPFGNHLLMYFA